MNARWFRIALGGLFALGLACSSKESPTPQGGGDSRRALTLVSDVAGITFTGHFSLKVLAVDPAGIAGVTLALGTGNPAVAGVETAAGNGLYRFDVESATLFPAQDVTVSAVFTATNGQGASSTLTVPGVHVDNAGPAITGLTLSPQSGSIYPGQTLTVTVDTAETVEPPTVTVSSSTNAGRGASLVSSSGSHFVYDYVPQHGDAPGTWTITATARDAAGNSTQTGGSFSLQADVAGTLVATASRSSLKLGASTTITATFSKPVSALPTVNVSGSSQVANRTSGSVGETVFTYSLSAPSTPTEEGPHDVVIGATTVAGEQLSATVRVTFDYTAPTLTRATVLAADLRNRDSGSGAALFHTTASGTPQVIRVASELGEPLPLSAVSARLDEGTAGERDLLASVLQLDPYAPTFDLPLDGDGASAQHLAEGTHTITIHATDAAGNVGTSDAEIIDVYSGIPSPALDPGATTAGVLGAGAAFTIGVVNEKPIELPTLAASMTGCVGAPFMAGSPAPYSPASGHGLALSGTVPAGANGSCTLELTGFDVYGNAFGPVSIPAIATDTTAPVIAWDTAPTATRANAGVSFSFHSSAPGDGAALTGTLFACLDATTPECAGGTALAVSATGPIATFTIPAAATSFATDAQHVVYAGFRDLAQNVATSTVSLRIDGVKPTLGAAVWTPAPAYQQGSQTTLLLSFSEPIDGASIQVSGLTGMTIGAPTPVGSGSTFWQVTVGAASCGGAADPYGGQPYAGSVSFRDVLGNLVASPAALPAVTCNAAPAITQASWTKTVVEASNAGGATAIQFTASVPVGGVTLVGAPPGVTLGNLATMNGATHSYSIGVSMPASCPPGSPYAIGFKVTDTASPPNTSATFTLASLACTTGPTIRSYTWSRTTLAPGQSANLTLVASEPLAQAPSVSAAAAGVTVAPSGGGGDTWSYSVTMPATCTTGFPGDGKSTSVVASLLDTNGSTTSGNSLGALTCSESRVSGYGSDAFQLTMQPYPDGIVRTTVTAAPGAVQGTPGLVGMHIEVTDPLVGALLGSGPVNADGSVAPFALLSNLLQPRIEIVDMIGNRTSIGAYPQTIELSFVGKLQSGSAPPGGVLNPIQAFDVSGTSAFFNPEVWLNGGIQPDGRNAFNPPGASPNVDPAGPGAGGTPVELGSCNPAAGAGPSYCGLAFEDGLMTTISSGIGLAGGWSWIWERRMSSPGVSGAPNVRYSPIMGTVGNTLYYYGGCTGSGPPSNCPELSTSLGVVYAHHFGDEINCQPNGPCSAGAGWQTIQPQGGTAAVAVNFYNGQTISDGKALYVYGGTDVNGNSATRVLKFDPGTGIWSDTGDTSSGVYPYSTTSTGSQYEPYSVTVGATTCSGSSRQAFVHAGPGCLAYLFDAPSLCNGAHIRPFYESCGTGASWGGVSGGFYGGTLVWDSSSQRLWMFGGFAYNGSAYVETNALYKGVWNGSAWQWSLTSTINPLPPRGQAIGFWDPLKQVLVITGGQNYSGSKSYNDVWEFNPATGAWRDAGDKAVGAVYPPNPPSQYYPLYWDRALLNAQGGAGTLLYDYWVNQPFGSYAHEFWSLRRESQERLLIKAPFLMPATFYNSSILQRFSIEIFGGDMDPNAEILIWDGVQWDTATSANRSQAGASYLFDSIPFHVDSSNYWQYFGFQPLLNQNGSVGNIYLLVKRAPGSAPGLVNSRTLMVDHLRVRINYK
jgi:hypothetical protein